MTQRHRLVVMRLALLTWTFLLPIVPMTVVAADGAPLNVSVLIARYNEYDRSRSNGMGFAKSLDAGTLAWGESYILMDYVQLYQATGDTRWLRNLTQHFDAMAANLTDHDSDGYVGWQTTRYSRALVSVSGKGALGATLIPDASVIEDRDQARRITGHNYEVEILNGSTYKVTNLNTGALLTSSAAFLLNPLTSTSEGSSSGGSVSQNRLRASGDATRLVLSSETSAIPEVTLTLNGKPVAGDRFIVQTTRPAPLEFLVHEGMILFPVAQFVEIAARDKSLPSDLRAKADDYLHLITERILPKWEPFWREIGGFGTYVEPDDPARWANGIVLPHNQYLMLARVYLALDAAADLPTLRSKATKMLGYFRNRLIPTHHGWRWYYRDTQLNRRGGPIEDTQHGALDVGAAVDAYQRGIVFSETDINRFAATLTKTMWNGSLTDIRLGANVSSSSEIPGAFPMRFWIDLYPFDPATRDLSLALFRRFKEPVEHIPTVLNAISSADESNSEETSSLSFDLEPGFNMIQVPSGVESVGRVSDLFDALGGADAVQLIVTLHEDGEFRIFTRNSTLGSEEDAVLTDGAPVIVSMREPRAVTLAGVLSDKSTALRRGVNLIGVPDSDESLTASDLLRRSDDIATIIMARDGEFVSYPPYDAPIGSGQAVIITARQKTTLTFGDQPESEAVASSPSVSAAVHARAEAFKTPVFVIEGKLVQAGSGIPMNDVTLLVTNLRLGESVATTSGMTSDGGQFAATFFSLDERGYEEDDRYEIRVVDSANPTNRSVECVVTHADFMNGRLSFGEISLASAAPHNALLQNYPNPFNPETWIPFYLSRAGEVTVEIYDIAGNRVRTLSIGARSEGMHANETAGYWNGTNNYGERVASGVYIYRLVTTNEVSPARRMVILK